MFPSLKLEYSTHDGAFMVDIFANLFVPHDIILPLLVRYKGLYLMSTSKKTLSIGQTSSLHIHFMAQHIFCGIKAYFIVATHLLRHHIFCGIKTSLAYGSMRLFLASTSTLKYSSLPPLFGWHRRQRLLKRLSSVSGHFKMSLVPAIVKYQRGSKGRKKDSVRHVEAVSSRVKLLQKFLPSS